MIGDHQVRFCERLRGETPLCLFGGIMEELAILMQYGYKKIPAEQSWSAGAL